MKPPHPNRGGLLGLLVAVALFGMFATRVVWAQEDCVAFNPDRVEAKLVNGHWKVVDGDMWLLDFGAGETGRTRAKKARDIIKHYRMTKQCFVGRPNAPMMYFRTESGFPQGSYQGQDCVSLNPGNVKAARINGRWKVVDCDHWLLDFGTSEAGARKAADLIRSNRLASSCFVGRPNAPMMYWLTDPGAQPINEVSLNVTLRPQETGMWCWAASGQMCMEFLGHSVAQCTQANRRFGRNDCCNIRLCPNPVGNHACVTGGWPEFGKYSFNSKHTSSAALSWDQLWNQIYCRRSPVAFTWAWVGGGGHMMVVRGLQILPDGTRMVQVNDPWGPCTGDQRFISYDAYDTVANDHNHWDDYYDISYVGGP